jgi:ATP-dependent DNA helicase RecQ
MKTLGSPPILALTATATPSVRDTTIESLAMKKPLVITLSPHRSNLAFDLINCAGDDRFRALLRLAQRLRRPGLIYCSTRREVDEVHALLTGFRIRAHRYHAGMNAADRIREQRAFMSRRRRSVMVATSAFGLGIDKRDLRYVVHFQSPGSLEQYVQEAGRCGRDGRRAHCILLYDPEDRRIHEALQNRSRIHPSQLRRLGSALLAWWKEGRAPDRQALAVSAEMGQRNTAALLAKIHEAGLVEIDAEGIRPGVAQGEFAAGLRELASQVDTLRIEDGHRLDSLAAYAGEEGCRARFLQRYFGELDPEDCGLCDRCRGADERPAAFFEAVERRHRPVTIRRRKADLAKAKDADKEKTTRAKKKTPRKRRRRRRPRRRRSSGAKTP